MKSLALLTVILLTLSFSSFSQETASLNLFDLQSQKNLTIESQLAEKGLVIIFHSIKCPFATMYEGRIKALESLYKSQGFNFILVNPDIENTTTERTEVKVYLEQKGFEMPYLLDEQQQWTKHFGITKIPEVLLMTRNNDQVVIAFRGAIDNNPQVETSVSEKYLVQAMEQIINGQKPIPSQVRPMGCNIRFF